MRSLQGLPYRVPEAVERRSVYPTMPYPTLSSPVLQYPTLPYPTLHYSTIPKPTSPYPTQSYPTLPYPTPPAVACATSHTIFLSIHLLHYLTISHLRFLTPPAMACAMSPCASDTGLHYPCIPYLAMPWPTISHATLPYLHHPT